MTKFKITSLCALVAVAVLWGVLAAPASKISPAATDEVKPPTIERVFPSGNRFLLAIRDGEKQLPEVFGEGEEIFGRALIVEARSEGALLIDKNRLPAYLTAAGSSSELSKQFSAASGAILRLAGSASDAVLADLFVVELLAKKDAAALLQFYSRLRLVEAWLGSAQTSGSAVLLEKGRDLALKKLLAKTPPSDAATLLAALADAYVSAGSYRELVTFHLEYFAGKCVVPASALSTPAALDEFARYLSIVIGSFKAAGQAPQAIVLAQACDSDSSLPARLRAAVNVAAGQALLSEGRMNESLIFFSRAVGAAPADKAVAAAYYWLAFDAVSRGNGAAGKALLASFRGALTPVETFADRVLLKKALQLEEQIAATPVPTSTAIKGS